MCFCESFNFLCKRSLCPVSQGPTTVMDKILIEGDAMDMYLRAFEQQTTVYQMLRQSAINLST